MAAQQQLLVFTKIWTRISVPILSKPFNPPHPRRVRKVKSAPGFNGNFFLRRRAGQHPRQPMIAGNGDGTHGNHIEEGILFQRFDLPGKAFRIGHIVLIHARKITTTGQIDRFIQSDREPLVFTIPKNPDPSVPNVRNILKRIVRRTIIDDQQFPIGERLLDNRKHGESQITSRIEHRHGHGNQG